MERLDRNKIAEMRREVTEKVNAAYEALRITWESMPGQEASNLSEQIFTMLEQQGILVAFMQDDRVYAWIDQVEAKAEEEFGPFGTDAPVETPRTESPEELFVRELKAALGPGVDIKVINLDEEGETGESESLDSLLVDY